MRLTVILAAILLSACSGGAGGPSFYGAPVPEQVGTRILASDYGAVGDGVTDNHTAIQNALDACHAAGGGLVALEPGIFATSQPLVLKGSTSLVGEGKWATHIKKTGSATKAVTVHAPALNCYGGNVLPSDINAVLVLTGVNGRYTGVVQGLGVSGPINGSYESPLVDFGIVSIGSCSDSAIKDCRVASCRYGIVLPDFWMGEIAGNRVELCLYAISIEAGTSTLYRSNYANNCRSWGHYLRGLAYCTITNNACDFLNTPAHFPARDNWCRAYIFTAMHGCTVTSNGQEMTNGVNWFFDAFDHSEFANNYSSSIGSDYSGVKHVAWIYSTNIMRWSRLTNNAAYYYNPNGLTHGSAVASKHHNIYFESTEYVSGNTMSTNIVRESYHGLPVEAGWGNNVTP